MACYKKSQLPLQCTVKKVLERLCLVDIHVWVTHLKCVKFVRVRETADSKHNDITGEEQKFFWVSLKINEKVSKMQPDMHDLVEAVKRKA